LISNGRIRVLGLFSSGLANERSRVLALAQKSVRTIAGVNWERITNSNANEFLSKQIESILGFMSVFS
jgi:hypothetical protein